MFSKLTVIYSHDNNNKIVNSRAGKYLCVNSKFDSMFSNFKVEQAEFKTQLYRVYFSKNIFIDVDETHEFYGYENYNESSFRMECIKPINVREFICNDCLYVGIGKRFNCIPTEYETFLSSIMLVKKFSLDIGFRKPTKIEVIDYNDYCYKIIGDRNNIFAGPMILNKT